jgi:hypothetical protein
MPAATARFATAKSKLFWLLMRKTSSYRLAVIGQRAAFGLIGRPFASEFALACYSLVRFGCPLDPVLRLAPRSGNCMVTMYPGLAAPRFAKLAASVTL